MSNQQTQQPQPRWIYGIWFADAPGHGVNWLGHLYREGSQWVFEYRFRVSDPESTSPFDGKDRKIWSRLLLKRDAASIATDEDAMTAAITSIKEDILPIISLSFPYTDFVDLQCLENDPKMLFELGSRPWANVKLASQCTPEELSQYDELG